VTTYVALLRAVNVAGNRVDMRELKAQFEAAGCSDVSTYINSGNVIFRDRRSAPTLTRRLERELGVRVALRPTSPSCSTRRARESGTLRARTCGRDSR